MQINQVAMLNGGRPAVAEPVAATVGIYTPYDLTPGGGEKVILTIAEHLSQTCPVSIIVDDIYSRLRLKALGRILNLDLERIKIVRYTDVGAVVPFDLFLAMGNEIVPPVPALGRWSAFLCQFPFPRPDHVMVERRPHWDHYDEVVVYSEFVRSNIRRVARLNTLPEKPVTVLWPPCFSEATLPLSASAKQALLARDDNARDTVHILSVGRFFSGEHCKRHDVMIEALADLLKLTRGTVDVELHLAGTLPPTNNSREYYLQLLEQSKDLPVRFHLDAEPDELEDLYRRATFYWHATGIQSDLQQNPETMEHFGITVVEGMAHGCVPLVVSKGGPADIVEDGASGLHYASRHELARKTAQLLKDEHKMALLRAGALERALAFSKEAFVKNVDALLAPALAHGPARRDLPARPVAALDA